MKQQKIYNKSNQAVIFSCMFDKVLGFSTIHIQPVKSENKVVLQEFSLQYIWDHLIA